MLFARMLSSTLRPVRRLSVGFFLLIAFTCLAFVSGSAVGVRAGSTVVDDRTQGHGVVKFCAMGDVPYSADEFTVLAEQVARLPVEIDFAVHLGDIKRGSEPCREQIYHDVAATLLKSHRPMFFIPGDNEWNDCERPGDAWRSWNKYFLRFDQYWRHAFRIFRPLDREENFSFVHKEVLFIGVNLVGGRVQDEQEWRERHGQNLEWINRNLQQFGNDVGCMILFGHARPAPKHRDFFEAFSARAKAFAKPVLYLHGDGHVWERRRPFQADNVLAVQVDRGGVAAPVMITVTAHAEQPFEFDRRLTIKTKTLDAPARCRPRRRRCRRR